MFSTKVIVAIFALAAPLAFAVEEERELTYYAPKPLPAPLKAVFFAKDGTTPIALPASICDYDCLSQYRFNDKIIAVDIPVGLVVTMCSDPGFGGHCQTFYKSTQHVVVGDGVSSVKVVFVPPPPPPPISKKRAECLKKGYKAHQCAAHGYRNRNLKTVNTSFLAEDHEQCMDVHYDMFLVVEGVHFAGLAVPIGQECPSVVFHSTIADDKSVEKVVMIADQEEVATFDTDSMHHLGSRPFGTIVKAFDNAPVGKEGAKFYDSITNNCVSLLRNMADPLDVSVDDAMIDFVTKKLLSTGDINLWDGIKNSPSLNLVVAGGKRMLKAANQEDLVRKLIKLYV